LTNDRPYRRSHPWISFQVDFHAAPPRLWTLLGQAVARCGQISGSALPPGAAEEMWTLYLIKGVQATTAIEGNTLSTEQIRDRIQGRLPLPPSQEYLGREVDNVLRACDKIEASILHGIQLRLGPDWIAACNRQVLDGLEDHLEEGVVPGEIPAHAVGVGRYRGAPRADCAFLLHRLCDWLEAERGLSMFEQPDDDRIATAILHSILAHLYIAWIHPFGDGNGRTARLVEFMLLARAGVPLTSAQLLSNHYNLTRAEYYRQLDRASHAHDGRGDPIGFILYALQGLVDGLAKQCDEIDAIQLSIAWKHFVFDRFRQARRSPALNRRREIALALTDREQPAARTELRRLDPTVAELYAGKTDKTLTRDINWLLDEDLIAKGTGGYRARVDRMRSFRPPRTERNRNEREQRPRQ
jgi:Fic family protein